MKKYWFYLEPYTFIREKQEEVMLYNTLSGVHILFVQDAATKPIVSSWLDANNLYGVELTESDMEKTSVKKLIFRVRESFSGDIVEIGPNQQRPVSLQPFLNFQMDRQRLENLKAGDANKQYGDRILHHLFELNLYITGICPNDCPCCDKYYKQTVCCTKHGKDALQPQQIEKLLQTITHSSVKCINILGGDLFSNGLLSEYMDVLNRFGFVKNYYSHFLNINENIRLINLQNSTLKIMVTFPVDEEKFEQAYQLTDIENLPVFWVFIISSEEEYFRAESLIKRFEIQKATIKPFYTGSNYEFFSKNTFTTLEDIDRIRLNRRQIYAHQYINVADFGKVTVMPDGKVYANVNQESLGTINDDIRDLIYNELVHGKSWLRIREQAPCNDCIYQWLCPSPSNYEIAMGRPDLCHIKPVNSNK